MLRDAFDRHYAALVTAWKRHSELRRAGASVAQLSESRLRLDQLRSTTNDMRRAFAPEFREIGDAAMTMYCDRYEESVFLFASNADWSGPEPRFTCVCGDPIGGAGSHVPAEV